MELKEILRNMMEAALKQVQNSKDLEVSLLQSIIETYEKNKNNKELTGFLDEFYNYKNKSYKKGYDSNNIPEKIFTKIDEELAKEKGEIARQEEQQRKQNIKQTIIEKLGYEFDENEKLEPKNSLALLYYQIGKVLDDPNNFDKQKNSYTNKATEQVKSLLLLDPKVDRFGLSYFASDETKQLINIISENLKDGFFDLNGVNNALDTSIVTLNTTELPINAILYVLNLQREESIKKKIKEKDESIGQKDIWDLILMTKGSGINKTCNNAELATYLDEISKKTESKALEKYLENLIDALNKNEITFEQAIDYLSNNHKYNPFSSTKESNKDFERLEADLLDYYVITTATITKDPKFFSKKEEKFVLELEKNLRTTGEELSNNERKSLVNVITQLMRHDIDTPTEAKDIIKNAGLDLDNIDKIAKVFKR